MNAIAEQLALLTTTTWAITETLKRFFKVDPRVIALCISLLLALIAVYTGYLPKTPQSFFLAIGGAMGSGVLSDKVFDGVRDTVVKK